MEVFFRQDGLVETKPRVVTDLIKFELPSNEYGDFESLVTSGERKTLQIYCAEAFCDVCGIIEVLDNDRFHFMPDAGESEDYISYIQGTVIDSYFDTYRKQTVVRIELEVCASGFPV
jgi:hypothetical protein